LPDLGKKEVSHRTIAQHRITGSYFTHSEGDRNMSSQKISRREFLHVGAAAAAATALAACQPKTVIVEVEKEKVVTQVVEVEKEVTKIVAGTPVVEKVVETKVVEVEKEVTKIVEVEKEPGAAGFKESPLETQRVRAGSLPPV
jgi:hypothetical protein